MYRKLVWAFIFLITQFAFVQGHDIEMGEASGRSRSDTTDAQTDSATTLLGDERTEAGTEIVISERRTTETSCCRKKVNVAATYFFQAGMHLAAAFTAIKAANEVNDTVIYQSLMVSAIANGICAILSVYRGCIVPICGSCADISSLCCCSSLTWISANAPLWTTLFYIHITGAEDPSLLLYTATALSASTAILGGAAACMS